MEIDEIINAVLDRDGDMGSDLFDTLIDSGIDLSEYGEEDIKTILKEVLDESNDSVDNAYNVSFGASSPEDVRNLAKSTLLDKLKTNGIYVNSIYTDKLYGGLTSYSGEQVYEAINEARDDKDITDSVYRELMSLLKKSCYYKS
ncbi:MAG: hypothetical protein IKA26_00655 [Alistipes sp.]|nr:hypothetical protein [Alistipes sp.]